MSDDGAPALPTPREVRAKALGREPSLKPTPISFSLISIAHISPQGASPPAPPGCCRCPHIFVGISCSNAVLNGLQGGETTTLRAEVAPRATCCADKLGCAPGLRHYPWRLCGHLRNHQRSWSSACGARGRVGAGGETVGRGTARTNWRSRARSSDDASAV